MSESVEIHGQIWPDDLPSFAFQISLEGQGHPLILRIIASKQPDCKLNFGHTDDCCSPPACFEDVRTRFFGDCFTLQRVLNDLSQIFESPHRIKQYLKKDTATFILSPAAVDIFEKISRIYDCLFILHQIDQPIEAEVEE